MYKPYMYKQERVAAGNKLFVISFAAPVANYESEVSRFAIFLDSFVVHSQFVKQQAQVKKTQESSLGSAARARREARLKEAAARLKSSVEARREARRARRAAQ